MSPILGPWLFGLVTGYLSFHQQDSLPGLWSPNGLVVSAPVTTVITLLSIWFSHVYLEQHRLLRLFVLALAGAVGAHLLAGPQAAERLVLRLPAECHGQVSQGQFRLVQATLLPEQKQSWTIAVQQAAHCLKAGAQLRVTVEAQHTGYLSAGELFKAQIKLRAPRASLQLQGFDTEGYWFANSIAGSGRLMAPPQPNDEQPGLNPLDAMRRARLAVSLWLVEKLANHPQTGLILALTTGDQGLINPAEREMFNETGIAHLVAISGLHITLLANLSAIWLGSVWKKSDRLTARIPRQLAGPVFGLIVASLYAVLSGWGIPAQRTLIMQLVASFMLFRGVETKAWNVWGLAMAAVLVSDPWAIRDVGFMLSFGALGALILACSNQIDLRSWVNSTLWQACRAQFAATVGLLPLTVWLFNQQSLVSPLANAFCIPWMSFVITPLAIGGAVFRQDWAIWLAATGLDWQSIWLEWIVKLEWSAWPVAQPNVGILLLAQVSALLMLIPSGKIPKILGTSALGLLLFPAQRPAQSDFWIDAHDVGQGTAITIRTAQHTLLYDTGPAFSEHSNSARRVIRPFLQSQGIRKIDSLWISHDDSDHTGGAAYLLKHLPIGQVVSSLPPHHPLLEKSKNNSAKILHCEQAKPWVWDGVLFEPMPIQFPNQISLKDNDRSCVLKVSNSKHSVLLTGDIEAHAEAQLVKQYGNKLASNLLFAPHHGSATSSTDAFLKAVQPRMVWIQAGWKNRFGHPHPVVLKRYKSASVTIFNTSQFGALHTQLEHLKSSPVIVSSRQQRLRYWHLHETSASFD